MSFLTSTQGSIDSKNLSKLRIFIDKVNPVVSVEETSLPLSVMGDVAFVCADIQVRRLLGRVISQRLREVVLNKSRILISFGIRRLIKKCFLRTTPICLFYLVCYCYHSVRFQ